MDDDPLSPEERRDLAALDLDRTVWDPDYRRYVMELLARDAPRAAAE